MIVEKLTQKEELLYAWAAGIIDGEGCITIVKREPHGSERTVGHRPTLKVSMRDKIVPYKLLEIFKVGRVNVEKNGTLVSYRCDGSPTLSLVLPKIIPYLTTKKPQAETLLEFLSHLSSGGRRRTTPEELKIRDTYYYKLKYLKDVAYGYETIKNDL